MRLRYLSPASRELFESIDYYEEADPGLGLRFYSELKKAEARVKKFPEGWMKLSPNTRRCRLEVFPYGIIYQIRNDEIIIVAIAHLKRKPMYWKNRIG